MSTLSHVAAAAARHVPAPIVRFVGRRQNDSTFWRRIGGVAKQAMSADGVIPHGQAAGLKFNAGGGNAGYALGTSEGPVQDAFADLLAPGMVVYDLGANAGFYTVMAARHVGSSGRVFAFEPLPANVRLIEHNVALNDFGHATVLPYAVGRESALASFTLGFDSTRGGLTDVHAEPNTNGSIEVRVRSLDSLIAAGELPPPQILKIDIEGAEVEALAGARSLLDQHRPSMLIEVHGTGPELQQVLSEHGYEMRVLGSQRPLSRAKWGEYAIATPLALGHTARSGSADAQA